MYSNLYIQLLIELLCNSMRLLIIFIKMTNMWKIVAQNCDISFYNLSTSYILYKLQIARRR